MTPQQRMLVSDMVKTEAFKLFYEDIEQYCQTAIMDKYSQIKLFDADIHDLHTVNKAYMLIESTTEEFRNYSEADMEHDIKELQTLDNGDEL